MVTYCADPCNMAEQALQWDSLGSGTAVQDKPSEPLVSSMYGQYASHQFFKLLHFTFKFNAPLPDSYIQ